MYIFRRIPISLWIAKNIRTFPTILPHHFLSLHFQHMKMNYFIDDDLHRHRLSMIFNYLYHPLLKVIYFRSPAFSNHISWAPNSEQNRSMYTYRACTIMYYIYAFVNSVFRRISLTHLIIDFYFCSHGKAVKWNSVACRCSFFIWF